MSVFVVRRRIKFAALLKISVTLRRISVSLCTAKRALEWWLAMALLTMTVSSATAHDASAEMLKRTKRAVVVITTYDDRGKPLLQGSGFFIESGNIITNMHVIKDACRVQIKTFDGKIYLVQGVIAADEKSDLALLQTNASSSETTTLIVEEGVPQEGEEIIAVGNPKGSMWKVSRGITGTIWNFQDIGELISITATILPGSSGGPVVNREGRVIGVAVMHTNSADDLNFVVPGEVIKTLRPGPLKPLPGLGAQLASR
jgi:S1-C subfamily serine protease